MDWAEDTALRRRNRSAVQRPRSKEPRFRPGFLRLDRTFDLGTKRKIPRVWRTESPRERGIAPTNSAEEPTFLKEIEDSGAVVGEGAEAAGGLFEGLHNAVESFADGVGDATAEVAEQMAGALELCRSGFQNDGWNDSGSCSLRG